MNLSEFFLPSSLESRLVRDEQQPQKQFPPLVRMPPRSAAKDVISTPDEAADVMAPTMMDHLHLTRSHHVQTSVQLDRIHSRDKDRREVLPRPSDLTFYVGRNRVPFTVSADTLKHSTYFASLLEKQRVPDPIVLDCDEGTFQNMILILRYGSFEALPKMSESELFRLKRELECYGIDVPESRKPNSPTSTSSSPHRHSALMSQSSLGARQYSQPGTPKHAQHRGAIHHSPSSSGDFPDLPEELKDPSKLFLVARMDDIEKGIRCECTGKDLHTYWALSFHHRHTFCTGCGRCPVSFSPRHLAEMYMAAAMYYSNENFSNKQRWSVGCDSTCSLKLLNAKLHCVCPCARTDNCLDNENSNISLSKLPAWAVSTYYSHAFCTRCGQAADERTLIYILLTHRYGGVSKHSKLRREHTAAASEGAVGQDLRVHASSPGSEILRHSRGNRSMWIFCFPNFGFQSCIFTTSGKSAVNYIRGTTHSKGVRMGSIFHSSHLEVNDLPFQFCLLCLSCTVVSLSCFWHRLDNSSDAENS